MTYEDAIMAEAVQSLAGELVKATSEAMTVHGNDPNGLAIVSAAFSIAIDSINDSIDNRFARMVVGSLKGNRP